MELELVIGDMFIVMFYCDVDEDKDFDFVFVDGGLYVEDKVVFEGIKMIGYVYLVFWFYDFCWINFIKWWVFWELNLVVYVNLVFYRGISFVCILVLMFLEGC